VNINDDDDDDDVDDDADADDDDDLFPSDDPTHLHQEAANENLSLYFS
jgi:hypothetical protein